MKEDLVHGLEFPSSILCVVDFSESSKRSLQWALQMAQLLHAHITVLYTFRLIQQKKGETLLIKGIKEKEAISRFTALEDSLFRDTRIAYDFKTEIGFLTDRIESYVTENATSFIVIDKSIMEESKETLEELLKGIQLPLVIIS